MFLCYVWSIKLICIAKWVSLNIFSCFIDFINNPSHKVFAWTQKDVFKIYTTVQKHCITCFNNVDILFLYYNINEVTKREVKQVIFRQGLQFFLHSRQYYLSSRSGTVKTPILNSLFQFVSVSSMAHTIFISLFYGTYQSPLTNQNLK